MDLNKVEEHILNCFNRNFTHDFGIENLVFDDLALGKYVKVLNSELCKNIFNSFISHTCPSDTMEEQLKTCVQTFIEENELNLERQIEILSLGVSALLGFVQVNWTGPPFAEDTESNLIWLCDEKCALDSLVIDGEGIYPTILYPQLLVLARSIIQLVAEMFSSKLPSSDWWLMRCYIIHQKVLEEPSPTLNLALSSVMKKLLDCPPVQTDLRILLYLETAQVYILYGHVLHSKEMLLKAVECAKMKVDLIGCMGKRTRYQQKELAQLTLKIEFSDNCEDRFNGSVIVIDTDHLPKNQQLDDDVRLEHVKFSNSVDGKFPVLQPIEQAVILGMFLQTQKSQPKDKLTDEELMPYLECVLSSPQCWCLQMVALMLRCKLESGHSRTVERAMSQCQVLVDSIANEKPSVVNRMHLFFTLPLLQSWQTESELASLLLSLGAVNGALDIFLRLQDWEAVIGCYHLLNLRHKAAEIIQQELAKDDKSVKLWCLLGDATDDVCHYEKAWELSDHRSGRAQRHWGLYYFHRKQYAESIPHLLKSLEINSLQASLWLRLGFAALEEEQWDRCAIAYQRYCNMDSENFEAWNNLAKAYVKLGQKARAWKALQEALKCNFDNWRVWDNLMIVSIDCGEFEEVIRAYHRILDLKAKHVDEEVLSILAKAVSQNLPDNAGVSSGRMGKPALELFGRLTSQVTNNPTIWRLYAELTASREEQTQEMLQRTAQYLQKAHRSAIQDPHWSSTVSSCMEVIKLCTLLADAYLQCCQKCSGNLASQMLSSARLAINGVLTKVKKEHTVLVTEQLSEDLKCSVSELEGRLEQICNEIQQVGN